MRSPRCAMGLRCLFSTHPWHRLALFLTLAVGAFLRLYRIGVPSLWRDEIETMVFSLAPLKKIIILALKIPFIPRPPLYFIISHAFLQVRVSAGFLRLPSALASIGALVITYYLARRWFGRRTALLATFLLAIAPFQIHYAQEGREYAFLMFLGLLDILCLDLALERGLRWLAPWTVLAVAIVYTHHFGSFILGAQWLIVPGIFLLGIRPKTVSWRRFLTVYVLVSLLVVACWAPLLTHFLSGVKGPRGMRGLTLKPIFSPDDLRVMAGLITFGNGPGTLLAIPLAALGFLPLGTRRKRGTAMAFLWILPVLLLTFFGHFAHAFRIRYYIFVFPIWFMAIARGVQVPGILIKSRMRQDSRLRMGSRWLRWSPWALVGAAVMWAGPYLLNYYREQRVNWTAAAAFLSKVTDRTSTILVTGEGERGINFHYFILDHYAGLGPRIKVFHVDLASDKEHLKLLLHGSPVWYIGTRPESKLPFRNKPGLLRSAGYTMLAPLVFGARTTLTEKEAKFLAPYRYKEVTIIPFWPDLLSPEEVREHSQKLLDEARRIPNGYLRPKLTEEYLQGKLDWGALSRR